jgi:hypothetical protein
MTTKAILDEVGQIAENVGLKLEQRVSGNAYSGVCYQMRGLDRVAIALVYFHQNALEINPLRRVKTMAGEVQRADDYNYRIAYGDPNLFAEVEQRLTSISSEVK